MMLEENLLPDVEIFLDGFRLTVHLSEEFTDG